MTTRTKITNWRDLDNLINPLKALVKGNSDKPYVLTIINRKGGVGKTTAAVNTAATLAAMGFNVGLIDTDSQGNSADAFGIQTDNSLYRVLVQDSPVSDEAVIIDKSKYVLPDEHPSPGMLSLIRSADMTHRIGSELDQSAPFAMLDLVEEYGEIAGLDFVVVDTNPTLGLLDGATYLATDGFIFITELEKMAMVGAANAYRQMKVIADSREKRLKRRSDLLAVIPNKLNTRTNLHRDHLSGLAEHFGVDKIVHPLRHLVAWAESATVGQPVYMWSPLDHATMDWMQAFAGIVTRLTDFIREGV